MLNIDMLLYIQKNYRKLYCMSLVLAITLVMWTETLWYEGTWVIHSVMFLITGILYAIDIFCAKLSSKLGWERSLVYSPKNYFYFAIWNIIVVITGVVLINAQITCTEIRGRYLVKQIPLGTAWPIDWHNDPPETCLLFGDQRFRISWVEDKQLAYWIGYKFGETSCQLCVQGDSAMDPKWFCSASSDFLLLHIQCNGQ